MIRLGLTRHIGDDDNGIFVIRCTGVLVRNLGIEREYGKKREGFRQV